MTPAKIALYVGVFAFGVLAPFFFPNYVTQISVLWLMVIFALTWDTLGGQMGYNSLGNIVFFGMGMYTGAIVQIGLYFDVGAYTAHSGAINIEFTLQQYWTGLILGILAAGVLSSLFAIVFGWLVFGLRGPYFAIGTLGVAIAAGELISTWDWVGGGGGISMPTFPSDNPETGKLVWYSMFFGIAVVVFAILRWLYGTKFGLAINAIRDDEEKAEGMGLHTNRHKTVAWSGTAFFVGMTGAIYGNMLGFFEPLTVAFPTITFGIFMVVMVLLGGKGTLWGPVIGAVVFHVIKEVAWTQLEGTQWVVLGLMIVIIVVYFQQGMLGWAMDRWPAFFGITVERKEAADGAPPGPAQ